MRDESLHMKLIIYTYSNSMGPPMYHSLWPLYTSTSLVHEVFNLEIVCDTLYVYSLF